MGATIRQNEKGIWVLNISGALRKEEMDAVQEVALQGLASQAQARVLVVVAPDFSGWVGKEVWADMSFFVEHGNRIAKIAIVGEPKWEDGMLMFAGAGFRRAPVKYFPTGQLAEAQAWLV